MLKAIERNRKRQAKFKKAERLLRRLRQRVFDYEDYDAEHGTDKYDRCQRIMVKCKAIAAPFHEQRRRNNDARKLERTPSVFE